LISSEGEQQGRRYTLDVKGYSCPYPQFYVIKALAELKSGDILEVILDNQPSLTIVKQTAEKRGCTVLSAERIEDNTWRIVIKR